MRKWPILMIASSVDHGNEDLRAEIKALQYELSTFKQERDLLVLRHEKELRDAQAVAEGDYRKTQVGQPQAIRCCELFSCASSL